MIQIKQNIQEWSNTKLAGMIKQKYKLWNVGYFRDYAEYMREVRPLWEEQRRRIDGGRA